MSHIKKFGEEALEHLKIELKYNKKPTGYLLYTAELACNIGLIRKRYDEKGEVIYEWNEDKD